MHVKLKLLTLNVQPAKLAAAKKFFDVAARISHFSLFTFVVVVVFRDQEVTFWFVCHDVRKEGEEVSLADLRAEELSRRVRTL